MTQNNLYPVFLKLNVLRVLIIGGGKIAEEKLQFLLKSSPNAQLRLIAPKVNSSIYQLSEQFNISIAEKPFEDQDIEDADLIIAATDLPEVNYQVYQAAKIYRKVINVADTPGLCDFYMGSIVTKGDIKIGISTNGKSPTFAKRLREYLEELLTEESNQLVQKLSNYRNELVGDFHDKVTKLNDLTESLMSKSAHNE